MCACVCVCLCVCVCGVEVCQLPTFRLVLNENRDCLVYSCKYTMGISYIKKCLKRQQDSFTLLRLVVL